MANPTDFGILRDSIQKWAGVREQIRWMLKSKSPSEKLVEPLEMGRKMKATAMENPTVGKTADRLLLTPNQPLP